MPSLFLLCLVWHTHTHTHTLYIFISHARSRTPHSHACAGVVLGVKTLECSCPHKFWKELDASRFSVRGPNYLKDRKKVSADKALFHLVAMDLFAFEDPKERFHIAARYKFVLALRSLCSVLLLLGLVWFCFVLFCPLCCGRLLFGNNG